MRAGPRLFFMTMVCSVLHGFATGCLGREYAEGLFEAMHILDLKPVEEWLENPGDKKTGATSLPLDLLALIWTASACVYCRSRGWKAWSAWKAVQDGLLKRLCGAGSEGFGIPAFFFISGEFAIFALYFNHAKQVFVFCCLKHFIYIPI